MGPRVRSRTKLLANHFPRSTACSAARVSRLNAERKDVRHTSDKQETSMWIALAAVWLSASLLAWLATLVGMVSVPSISGDRLILLATLVAGVSLALRLPILTESPITTCFTNQVVWLLTLAANVNWFGCLCLRAEGWLDALPAAVVLGAGEVWVHRKVNLHGCLPDLCASLSALRPKKWFPATASRALETEFRNQHLQNKHLQNADLEKPSELGQFQRQTFAGVDEEGQPYCSGEIRVELEPLQTTASLVVAFSPTFAGTPMVELESEVENAGDTDGAHSSEEGANATFLMDANDAASTEELAAQVTTCTPAGMRIHLRRSAAAAVTHKVHIVRWYASLPPGGAQTLDNAATGTQTALP